MLQIKSYSLSLTWYFDQFTLLIPGLKLKTIETKKKFVNFFTWSNKTNGILWLSSNCYRMGVELKLNFSKKSSLFPYFFSFLMDFILSLILNLYRLKHKSCFFQELNYSWLKGEEIVQKFLRKKRSFQSIFDFNLKIHRK